LVYIDLCIGFSLVPAIFYLYVITGSIEI
jgi:hypothetical protein